MTTANATSNFRASLIQMCSGRDVDKNVSDASAMIREAAASGAHYVQTPEVTSFMDLDRDALLRTCEPESGNKALKAFQNLADELGLWLHIGSIPILLHENGAADPATPCFANRSFLIEPDGRIGARYDKIHMFDVSLANGETYFESRNYRHGDKAVVAKTPWGGLGLTICYDLRFPHLHRALAQAGAKLIAIPAAFTRPTGEAHWHVLIRARAIETQCYVLAAAQGGLHEHGRATYGHSLIVSPWGEVIAEGGTEPGIVSADIDMGALETVRSRVPSLRHDKPFEIVSAVAGAETLEPTG